MKYCIGIDVGTSGTKTLLMDQTGRVIKTASAEYPMMQPQNGWAEQDPALWWGAAVKTLRAVLDSFDAADVVSVGLSGQMHGLVLLGEDDRVLRPAIICCDQRTTEEVDDLNRLIGKERFVEIAANPPITGFTAAKILWVQKHEPELWAQVKKILLPKDYVRLKLTGTYATDVSDASGMQLMDVAGRCWSGEILDKMGIRPDQLGRLVESPEATGSVTPEASRLTGLPERAVVVGGAGDNAASAVGTGVVREGTAFLTVGTSAVLFGHTRRMHLEPEGRVHTLCAAVPGEYHIMGVVQSAGMSLRWLRDACYGAELAAGQPDLYSRMDDEAATIAIGADKLLFAPYLMGERTPFLDANCRGAFFGLSSIHTRAHLVRAVLEGVGYALRDSLELFRQMHLTPEQVVLCGGGAKSPLWKQMLCDIYGLPFAATADSNGGAYGAAILGAVGAGLYDSVQAACDAIIRITELTQPDAAAGAEYERYYRFFTTLYPALHERFDALAAL